MSQSLHVLGCDAFCISLVMILGCLEGLYISVSSIHLLPLWRCWVVVAEGLAGYYRHPSPQQRLPAPPGGSQDICNPSSEFWVCPGISSLICCAWKTSKERRPAGILITCPNHLSRFLSTRERVGSTPSSPGMSEPLTRFQSFNHYLKLTTKVRTGW